MQSSVPATATKVNKEKYKLKNWSSYNKSLCQRGSVTIWLTEEVLQTWSAIDPKEKVVGQQTYPASVILCCLVLKMQYRQPLRQATGFVSSILSLLGKGHYSVPDYTTLCRRQETLPVAFTDRWEQRKDKNIVIAIDSTGLKVHGEGEWKVRKHGASKRRTWRKLHIGIDVETQEIIAVSLTGNDEDDARTAKKMLAGKTDQVKCFLGDGGYDKLGLRAVLGEHIEQIIPPPKNAVVHKGTVKKPAEDYLRQRNEAVERIEKEGSKAWKESTGYHRRSLNEVSMHRYKTVFGGTLQARKTENEETEVKLKCKILNKYTTLGMPMSYKHT